MRYVLFTLLFLAIINTTYAQDTTNCPSTTPLQLVIGQQGRVLAGGGANRVRDIPSTAGSVLYQIEGGATFDVIGQSACGDGYRWWQVSVDGQAGWTVEGDDNAYFLAPVSSEAEAEVTAVNGGECDLAPRLVVGGDGQLISNTPSRVRETPSINGVQVGQLQPLTTFSILEGAVCADGINWWRVSAGDLEGWTAEGVAREYLITFIEPTPTPTPAYIGLPNPTELSWNSDGTLIAVGTDDGIFIYDTADLRQPPTQIFAESIVHSLVFVPNNPQQLLISLRAANANECDGDSLSGVFMYDLDADEISLMIRDFTNSCAFDHVAQLQVNAEGTVLITNTSGQFVAYALPSGEFALHIAPHNFNNFPQFDQVAISADASQLALAQLVSDTASYLFRADYNVGQLVGFEDGRITDVVTALALSPDGDRIFIGDAVGSLRRYTRAEGTEFYGDYQSFIRGERSSTSNRINAIALDPDGMIVTAESDPQAVIRVFEPETLTQVASYLGGGATSAALDLAFNPDGSLLAVLVDDTVHILDASDYTQLEVLVLRQN